MPIVRLGLTLGPWTGATRDDLTTLAREAERLGFAVLCVPEVQGADAATVLAWLAARTERIGLMSAVLQIPGRTPVNAAMTAASLDALSGGRFTLGLGVSGPQVSEGLHGVPFDRPLARTRDYVAVVRLALTGEPVVHAGEHLTLPRPDGQGKALRLTLRPVQERLPLHLAAIGPRSTELAGELADGWIASFFAPEQADDALGALRRGRGRAGASLDGFDVVATTALVVGEEVQRCADAVRPQVALYLGGMGGRDTNFYNQLAGRLGFAAEARTVQGLFLSRRYAEAAAAVPFDLLDRTALLGTPARIAERLEVLAGSGVTTVALALPEAPLAERLAALQTAAAAARL